MLSTRLLRQSSEVVRAGLVRRHASAETLATLDAWYAEDARRRELTSALDGLRRGRATQLAPDHRGTVEAHREHEQQIRTLSRDLDELEASLAALARRLPNLPDARVPNGAGPGANVVLREWGQQPSFPFMPRAHDELAGTLGILDLPRATRLAGPRFPLLLGMGARLARALAAFMLDLHRAHGYAEVAPPHLVRGATLEGTGHLPAHAEDLYAVERDGLYLSPTAEVQLVALHAGELLREAALPLAYTAVTPAFRREAGSAGRASRGLLRQHQFDKVELVRVVPPLQSDDAFEAILADAAAVLERLELPYRVVALCAGGLPFAAARTCDLEVWMAGQGRYVEISSVSDCGAYQARGLRLRYAPSAGGRARHPHTLNGSALPIGRTLAALLEHGQRENGSVALPEALAPYLGEHELRPG